MLEHLPEKGCERRADPAGERALAGDGGPDPAGTHISSPCPRCRRASWPRSSRAPSPPHPAPDRARCCHRALPPPGGGLRAAPLRAPGDTTPRTGVWGSPAACPCPAPLPALRGPGSPSPGERQPHLHLPCAPSSSMIPPLPTCLTLPSGSPSSHSSSSFQLHSPVPLDGPCPRDLHIPLHIPGALSSSILLPHLLDSALERSSLTLSSLAPFHLHPPATSHLRDPALLGTSSFHPEFAEFAQGPKPSPAMGTVSSLS